MRRSERRLPPALGAGLAGLVTLLSASTAGAYCRTSSCMSGMPHTAAVCDPPQPDDCGIALFWPKACTEFSVQEAASDSVTFAQTEQLMKDAFASWMNAPCASGGTPHILVTEAAPAICDKHEYNQTAGNANIILYHDDMWPYEGSPNTLALTTVTYNLDTGEIYDADMELNSADNDLTASDTNVDFDLLSIVTHESGHFLGLAHSADSSATMWAAYNQGTIDKRNLSPDDIAGICAIYPPGAPITDCDPTPRHGFSPLCAADQPAAPGGCCSVAPGSTTGAPGGPYAGLLAALGAVLLAARHARRRSTR